MNMTQLQPFVAPNAAGDLLAKQKIQGERAAAANTAALEFQKLGLKGREVGVSEGRLGLDALKLQGEQQDLKRKNRIEELDFVLNVLAGVNSDEDVGMAKKIINSRYPEYSKKTDEMLFSYEPNKIRMIKESLRTETGRLKSEEIALNTRKQTFEESKPIGFAPGTMVMQQGKETGQVPFKPEGFELFTDTKGNQAYLREGGTVPAGFKRVDKTSGPSVVVQTGDLGKGTKTEVEKEIIKGVQNIQSFRETEKLYKPEYLTLFGKGEKALAGLMDKAGVATDKQKELIGDRAAWFRQAKADFIAFRKWATGVAGGEKELKEIATAFPDPVENSPTQYAANLRSIQETTKQVLQLNADFLRLGINMEQPLDKIMEEATAKGFGTPLSDESGKSVTITFTRDEAGNLVRSDQ